MKPYRDLDHFDAWRDDNRFGFYLHDSTPDPYRALTKRAPSAPSPAEHATARDEPSSTSRVVAVLHDESQPSTRSAGS